ncbi:hypothetical protein UNDYM_4523 [Undibacterium sp. YM2]|uniref:MerR family transcriptional regulator n=1 Tax=Undibacterium sp. YM2 TaxID=2058625 RepID=UPI001331CCDF|nr:MerR family transcriptional regulator [Undibacterium sp. YM2]BBB68776.1 hypothetical protein UNDYM_4523 [Undibacterium sp. YM2]
MNNSSDKKDSSYLLPELCLMAEMSVRTVRYYMQIGLVSKPEGGTRAARYGAQHLEQLLLIKKWSSAGYHWSAYVNCCTAHQPRWK